MSNPPYDQAIVGAMFEKLGIPVGEQEEIATYDEAGNLVSLALIGLGLLELPLELWQLTTLQTLILADNLLANMPAEVQLLVNLQEISLHYNKLTSLPPELCSLTKLQKLDLSNNQLNNLPEEIGYLTALERLYLDNNRLESLPAELCSLLKLRELSLVGNKLPSLPPSVTQLHHLQDLFLGKNQLTGLPPEIGKLTGLGLLRLNDNRLGSLPPELGQLTTLHTFDLSGNQLTSLPSTMGQLTNLKSLNLSRNQLASLPLEVGRLIALRRLDLPHNQLSSLPPETGQLTVLQTLNLSRNQLSSLPPELGQLTALQTLNLSRNQLSSLPPETGQLTALQTLDLTSNRLHTLPAELGQLTHLQEFALGGNQLDSLPRELWQLINLQNLYLWGNPLATLPMEVGQLIYLQALYLQDTCLTSLPPELGQLTNLQEFALSDNLLTTLPEEVAQLTNLQLLDLSCNKLESLPPEIGQLTALQTFDISDNHLASLPSTISQLTDLYRLGLVNNPLKRLPPELGHLTNLKRLMLNNNPNLLSPPPEVVAQGTEAVLAFLRELHTSGTTRYESKLLVVGEGGTGKSSLLRALRGDAFDPLLNSTHGITVNQYCLPHPVMPAQAITLNTWDFGGQEIYHATHQFFLTQRSLYLLVWNARTGAGQGRLDYWLDTIQALAPDTPVLLVATHIDERAPDLNYAQYQEAYPQLVGFLAVSNRTSDGIDALKAALAEQAAALPLMGQPWPQRWLDVEQALNNRTEHHITADTYADCCTEQGIMGELAKGTLGSLLHDLGKILYFRDDTVLCNLVVLKPNWITKAISRVLTDESTSVARGVLSHADLPRIWANDEDGQPYERHLYPVFLRLMERFDLSYQIEADEPGEHPTRSLVPQLLPHQPPADLPPWPEVPPDGQSQVEMVYSFKFVPAGIMSWFIVRTHRYTRNLHWRDGVLLAYEGHQARVELNPMLRELRLVVQGPLPQNFFNILKHTIDLILNRFEGLQFERRVPCICHWKKGGAKPCKRFYLYDDLERRMEKGKHMVECPDSFDQVSVSTLLYGIHRSTTDDVLANLQQVRTEIKQGQRAIYAQLTNLQEREQQQSELLWRFFTRQWNLEMHRHEAECPNTFYLLPGSKTPFNPKNWVSQEYRLHLVCQHPPAPHSVGEGYLLRQSAEWWKTISPWLVELVKFLKFGVPMAGKIAGVVYDAAALETITPRLDLLEQIISSLPDAFDSDSDLFRRDPAQRRGEVHEQAFGPALRALHTFLKEADPVQEWAGLVKTITPDGAILWLCAEHRATYEPKPLVLPDEVNGA